MATQINPNYEEPKAPWWKKALGIIAGLGAVVTAGAGLAALAPAAGGAAAAGAAGGGAAGAAGAGTAAGAAGTAAGTAGTVAGSTAPAVASTAAKIGAGLGGLAKVGTGAKIVGGLAGLANQLVPGPTYQGEGVAIPSRSPSKISGIIPPAQAQKASIGSGAGLQGGLAAAAGLMEQFGNLKTLVNRATDRPEVADAIVQEAHNLATQQQYIDALGGQKGADYFQDLMNQTSGLLRKRMTPTMPFARQTMSPLYPGYSE